MRFQLSDCEVGIKVSGVNYVFTHVDSVTIEDPEFTRLTRGANAGNKTGLVYREGLKEPKRITCMIADMSIDLKAVLDACFRDRSRLDVYAIASNGSSKMGKNCILCQVPQQLTLDDTPESLNVQLIFETFDLGEVFKE